MGVSSHVITERESSTAPSNQLADAQHYISTKKLSNFTFTHDVSLHVQYCSLAIEGPIGRLTLPGINTGLPAVACSL